MKRYTITNNRLGKTWIMEMEDLHGFYQNGLPDEYKDADIEEEVIPQTELDARVQALEQRQLAREAAHAKIEELKKKPVLSNVELQEAVKALLAVL